MKFFAQIYLYMCIFIYMLAIAGQTAEPNWLKKLEGTHWFPGGYYWL